MASGKRSPEARARRRPTVARVITAQASVVDAAERRVVRLSDGRTGCLLSVPAQSARVSAGAKARVELPSGAVVSVPMSDLVVVA